MRIWIYATGSRRELGQQRCEVVRDGGYTRVQRYGKGAFNSV
jgi:hypothetical protein